MRDEKANRSLSLYGCVLWRLVLWRLDNKKICAAFNNILRRLPRQCHTRILHCVAGCGGTEFIQ